MIGIGERFEDGVVGRDKACLISTAKKMSNPKRGTNNMSNECQLTENKAKCPCTSTDCVRYGACCKCVAYHREEGDLPACLKKNR